MTSTMRPYGRGSRRAVPDRLDPRQQARLRFLLEDPETWVMRTSWERFLMHGDHATLIHTADLTRDQCVAALAWLRQNRHALHRVLEGDPVAPDGWLESFPLVQRLVDSAAP